jgi:hypothetical protein
MSWLENVKEYINAVIANQLTETSPRAIQPAWIRTALRPHQLSLLEAARRLEAKATIHSDTFNHMGTTLLTRYGVIADRVGAGKSLVALSLVRDPPVESSFLKADANGAATMIRFEQMPDVQDISAAWFDMAAPAEPVTADSIEAPELSSDDDDSGVMSHIYSSAYSHHGIKLARNPLMKRLFPSRNDKFYMRQSLIIVPHNIASQWETYIKEQTNLRAYCVRKTKDCDWERADFYRDIFMSDLVLVSCTMLKKFIGAMCWYNTDFRQFVWSRLFIDEADTITCGLKPHEVSARFMWFITGSWRNMAFPNGFYTSAIHLTNAELHDVMDGHIAGVRSHTNIVGQSVSGSMKKPFTQLILRNSDEWINTSLLRPTITHDTILCKAPANLGILQGFISPAALEALHAGDVAGALSALGLKAASKETLVDRVTANLRADVAQAQKLLEFKSGLEYSSKAAKTHAIERAEAKVAQLKAQLAALEERVATATTQLCPICYDTPRTATLTPCCRQSFCLECLCECMKKKTVCPLCRQAIGSVKNLLVIGEGEEVGAGVVVEEVLPTKGAALLKLITDAPADRRFLVFSAHEASFKGLREVLEARGIRSELLSGTAARIDKLRKQFVEGKVRVLCMNARHVGAGLNLEAATDIVLYHKMNQELEKQVIGRAVRFERMTELRVTHLVHDMETTTQSGAYSEVIVHV